MLRIVRYSTSLARLWVKHNGSQATQVSTASCVNVSDLAEVIKQKLPKKFSAYDSDEITIHQALDDTALEPDVPLASISAAGLSAKRPLLVKVPGKRSKVGSELHLNATIEEKESLLEDLLQARDREVKAKDSLLEELREKIQKAEAERALLKGTLDARHILETYEGRFRKAKLSRAENWGRHLELTPTLVEELKKCDKNIEWHDKVAEIYESSSRDIRRQTLDLGGERYILMIQKSLPKLSVCFIQAIAKELYSENVTVKVKVDEGK